MKKVIFILVIATQIIFSSCTKNCIYGDGDVVTQSIELSDFTGVLIESSINVNIAYGESQSVFITGYENLLEHVDLSVNNNILKVDMKNGSYSNLNIELDLEIPSISKLIIDGSGDINIDEFTIPDLDILIDGSGDINATRNFTISNKLDCVIDGSGDVSLVGSVPEQAITVKGAGHFYGFDLQSEICNVLIDGSGDVEILVSDALSVDIQGSADTYYRGNPNLTIENDGSGEVINAN